MDKLTPITKAKTFSYTGYLSSHAYYPKAESELHQLAQQHTCPCCQGHLSFNTTQWRNLVEQNDGRLLLALHCLCYCGFSVPFYAVVNYLRDPLEEFSFREDAHHLPIMYPSSKEAALFECRFLIHIGKFEMALSFLDSAQGSAISKLDSLFFKGYCHEQLDHQDQALRYYDQCLDLNPAYGEVWYNKWRILKNLGRTSEAEFHKVKYKLYSLTKENIKPPKRRHYDINVLSQGLGKNGKVQVLEIDQQRSMYINQELQSSFWLLNGQPSSVPSNPDSLGMLLNGCHFKADEVSTRGLVLGLGAGAGIVALLHNFSKLHVTVVEHDPVIIQSCLRNFPVLHNHIESGRLKLCCEDAYGYVAAMRLPVDFIVADLYQGNFEPCPRLFDLSFFDKAKQNCDLLSVNLKHPESHFERNSLIHYFSWPDIGLNHAYELESNFVAGYEIYHTVLFSEPINHIDRFTPYKAENGFLQTAFRRDFYHRFQQKGDRDYV